MTMRFWLVSAAFASSLVVLLTGCPSNSTRADGCPSINPMEREGPAPFVSMRDQSYSTQRYKNFAVFLPGVSERVVARADNPRVLYRHGASLQPTGVYATSFGATHKGDSVVTMIGRDGKRYHLQVTVAC